MYSSSLACVALKLKLKLKLKLELRDEILTKYSCSALEIVTLLNRFGRKSTSW
jgi:hypothetical protein